MLNPPAPVKQPTVASRASKVATKIGNTVSRNREIALVFAALILGYIFGKL